MAIAAGKGIAYDSVMKPVADPPAYTVANFSADFQAASKPDNNSPSVPIAMRHFLTERRQRIDYVTRQRATITDCDARTITVLDLADKSYVVRSFDEPLAGQGTSTPAPGADFLAAAMQMMTFSGSITTKELGPRSFDGRDTDGYGTEMTATVAMPNGASFSNTMSAEYYFVRATVPALACAGEAQRQSAAASMAGLSGGRFLPSGLDAAFDKLRADPSAIKRSGPSLPQNRVPLFATTRYRSEGMGFLGTYDRTTIVESGNIRTIDDDDKIFKVPDGFTLKTQ